MSIHHAPWSGRFMTMWFKGAFAYELQVGCVVFWWRHDGRRPRFTVWIDRYTNYPSYRRHALWGVAK